MEQNNLNRFDVLREPSPSPTPHEPTPLLHAAPAPPAFISAHEAMVLREAIDEPIALTPTPSESLNNSTLVPTATPSDMTRIYLTQGSLINPTPAGSLDGSGSPPTELVTGGARLLANIRALEESSSYHPSLASNPADHADDPEYLAALHDLLNVPETVTQEVLSQISTPSQRLLVAVRSVFLERGNRHAEGSNPSTYSSPHGSLLEAFLHAHPPTPPPESPEQEASRLLALWLTAEEPTPVVYRDPLRRDYQSNTVGDRATWELACWLHRNSVARVDNFVHRVHPSINLLQGIQHAFATRLTRLHNHPDWHSEHAQHVSIYIARRVDPGLGDPQHLVQPLTLAQDPAGATHITISDGSSSEMEITTSQIGAIRRARSIARSTPVPLSRRPSLSLFREPVAAQGAPGDSSSSDSSDSDTPKASPTEPSFERPFSSTGPTAEDLPMTSILVDTPSASSVSNGGLPVAKTVEGNPSPSPPQAFWGDSTQTQEAKNILDELRTLATQPRMARENISPAPGATVEAVQLADLLNPTRLGYAYYVQRDGLPPLKEGVVVGSEESMNAAFDVVTATLSLGLDKPAGAQLRALSLANWFRAAALTLSALIRGILVSDNFFTQGDFPLSPCPDDYRLPPGLPHPITQRELLSEMVAQLSHELTALGENRLNRTELWSAIVTRERDALQSEVRTRITRGVDEWANHLNTVLKGSKVEDAFTYLIARLEEEGPAFSLARTTAGAMQSEAALFKQQWELDNANQLQARREGWIQEAIEAQRAAAIRDAERHWHEWRDDELSKARGEAMRRISLDEIICDCGDDAALLIQEKREFAKNYVATHYQTWVEQELDNIWPQVQFDAQKVSEDEYFKMILDQTYPEICKEVEQKSETFREKLTQEKEEAIRADAVLDLYLLTKKPKTKGKGKAKSNTAAQQLALAAPKAGAKQSATSSIRTSSVAASDHVSVVEDETDVGMVLLDEPTRLPSPVPGETNTERIEAVAASIAENLGGNPFRAFGLAAAMLDPFRHREPSTAEDETAIAAATTPDRPIMVKDLQINPEVAATRSLTTSVHGPGNAMEAEPSPSPVPDHGSLPDDPLAAFKAVMLEAVGDITRTLTARLDSLSDQVKAIDRRTGPGPHPPLTRPAPLPMTSLPAPVVMAEVALTVPALTPPTPTAATLGDQPASQGNPESSSTSSPSPPAPAKGKETAAPVPAPKATASPPKPKGKKAASGSNSTVPPTAPPGARVDDPLEFPPLPTTPAPGPSGNAHGAGSGRGNNDGFISVGRRGPSYNIVSAKAIQQQTASFATARAATAAQNRTPQGRPKAANPQSRNVTKVVVIRHGGFEDPEEEKALRALPPGHIVHQVRTMIERSTSSPIKLLSGTWTQEVAKTGNFAYTIVGKIPMTHILTFAKHLLEPFPGGCLVPTEGWCWAHIREVVAFAPDGSLHEEDALMDELRLNPTFATVPIVHPPYWAQDVTKTNSITNTVIFAYIDPTNEVTQAALSGGISMFSYGAKFVFAGDSARPKQCGRCFEMGHNTGNATCKWSNRNRCFKCGKNHHAEEHDFHCSGQHRESGKCDCKPTCITCGKSGHHARSWRGCPAHGDFPPPRQAKKLELPPTPEAPAFAPKSILKRPTAVETPSPPETTPLFDAATLAAEVPPLAPAAPTPSAPPAPATAPKADAPKPRPKARIVTPSTDKAKANETSTERAAKRPRPASPSSIQGPRAPTFAKVRGDTEVTQMGTALASVDARPGLVRSSSPSSDGVLRAETATERLHALFPPSLTTAIPHDDIERAKLQLAFMQEELKTGHIMVTVEGVWYDCPTDDLPPAFHALRNAECAHLFRIIMDDITALRAPIPFTELAYQEAARASKAFGTHDAIGAPLSSPAPPTAIVVATPPIPTYAQFLHRRGQHGQTQPCNACAAGNQHN
ncbi:hypothetical protein EDB83DRAFT_2536565 [Lactarius deliciosus]|nr:hypothetical protein EDB83DRAFT_2536565 [Lactarius deliciosus]